LRIPFKATATFRDLMESLFAIVTERRMAQVMGKTSSVHQVRVGTKGATDLATYLSAFERV
jgi:hypothetical protein